MEIGKWGNEADITSKIPSKVSPLTIDFCKEIKSNLEMVNPQM